MTNQLLSMQGLSALYDRLLGVLNVHHSRQPGAFDAGDVGFVEQLAGFDAQILRRAEDHASLRDQAARYAAVRDVGSILAQALPPSERLTDLCHYVAGSGVASLHLLEGSDDELVLEAYNCEIDRVDYPSGTVTAGRSRTLRNDRFDDTANNNQSNWCDSTTVISDCDSNSGTPGAPNIDCP